MADSMNMMNIQHDSQAMKDLVVCGRNLVKAYGFEGSKKTTILNGLDINVKRGTIYGLLGSSGCGKTTLLTCLVGTRKIDSGTIWVLGGSPGKEGSGIPGPSIGYMPQELSLIERFTVAENLRFFGLLCGRSLDYIASRSKKLIELLDLPSQTRWASNLSGGQRRRLSLAIAMLHSPQLLVLDEPTVGVDPVLRVSIWNYLAEVTEKQQITVIVTTHYIEEARQANTVGLMRNGVLIAEDDPENLLLKHNASCLEDVFLKLSVTQIEENTQQSLPTQQAEVESTISSNLPKQKGENIVKVPGLKRIQVILWKLVLDTFRNPAGYFFIFLLPIIQTTIFCVTVGRDPSGLHLSVVNSEIDTCDLFQYDSSNNNSECNFKSLSCHYLKLLQEKEADFKQKFFYSREDAELNVKKGKSWGVLYFPPNFTINVLDRLENWQSTTDDVMNASEIEVTLDMSNVAISQFIKEQLYDTFADLLNEMANSCGWDERSFRIPYLKFPQVYGVKDTSYINFIVPGILGVVGFLLSAGSTGGYVLTDKEEGIFLRSIVCGMKNGEAYVAYMVINTVITAVQSVITLLLVFWVFALPNTGSWTLTNFLLFVQGISGITFGLLVSSIVGDLATFTHITLGYNITSLFISGNTWPVEGMHWLLQYYAKITHFTLVIQAFRSILFRGWGFTKTPVYGGFALSAAWIVIHVALLVVVNKLKKLE